MFKLGGTRSRSVDRIRFGLLHLVLHRLRTLNANTRLLVRLLEEPDWSELRTQALRHIRKRVLH